MQDFHNKKVLLGVCGGIAIYKAAMLVRELVALGAIVRVIMTESAETFMAPMTFQALGSESVHTLLLDEAAERAMGHIALARWADYLLIAPATANCLSKMASGAADDLLSTVYLVTEAPVLVCPAMNHSMWSHPATTANVALLKTRGVVFVGPEEGETACGEFGLGRMASIHAIIDRLRLSGLYPCLQDQHVLITAGPTREVIDPVRYISNHSSGKMGYALATAAVYAGARVTLITGPTALPVPLGVDVYRVESANEMHASVMAHLKHGTILIGTAAVADYGVVAPAAQKIKKQAGASLLAITLHQNPDVIAAVVATGLARYVVGFAAETESMIAHATEKLRAKQLDMIVANMVSDGIGFDADDNEVTVITHTETHPLPCMHKVRLSAVIISIIADNIQNKD